MRPDEAEAVLALLRAAFAYMEPRIDPPSSLRLLTATALRDQNRTGEVWLACAPEGMEVTPTSGGTRGSGTAATGAADPATTGTMPAAACQEREGGSRILACMVLTPRPGALYLGKLAVAAEARGRGLSRRMVAQAERRARALGLPRIELQSRVELTENHAVFRRLGFQQTGATAHAGHDRPTSLSFARVLPDSPG